MFSKTDIFEYELPGHGRLYADPLAVRRGLLRASDGRLWEWAQAARQVGELVGQSADDPTDAGAARRAEFSTSQSELEGRLADAAYAAFGLPPINAATGQGVAEAVALDLLQKFLGWMEEKKNPPAGSPT